MKTKQAIAVSALVEHVLRSGDLEHEFTGPNTSLEGIRAHQRIQKARPSDYLSEVSVSRLIETESIELMIGGRIDGVFLETDRGVALLVDQRFATYPYRPLLHREWHAIWAHEPGQIATIGKRFWGK